MIGLFDELEKENIWIKYLKAENERMAKVSGAFFVYFYLKCNTFPTVYIFLFVSLHDSQ